MPGGEITRDLVPVGGGGVGEITVGRNPWTPGQTSNFTCAEPNAE